MAQKKSYSRYFIILQEDEKGYALAADKAPTGYTKLETKNDKCKVSFYVQNLKKESAPYYMVLICNKKDFKKIIEIGKINIDEFGRADVSLEYSADNIAQSGISTDKISGAAVVRYIDSNIIAVMDGFSSVDIPEWRKYSILRAAVENKDIESRKDTEEKSIFDKYEENIQIIKKEISDKDIRNEEDAENKKEEKEEKEEVEVENQVEKEAENKKEDIEIIEADAKQKIEQNSEKEINYENLDFDNSKLRQEQEEDYPIGEVGDFFRNIVSGFEEIQDVSSEIKRCRWYKVPVKDIEDMMDTCDYNRYTVAYYPMINYYPYIKKYGHYLIGHKCDAKNKMKYLVYAIPGTKAKTSQPYGGKSGFVTWIPMKDNESNENSMGYWLMFYDFRTSTIVIPVK